MQSIDINLRSLQFNVVGQFYPGCVDIADYHGTYSPGEDPYFDIHKIEYKSVDVTDMFYELFGVNEIQEKCIQHFS